MRKLCYYTIGDNMEHFEKLMALREDRDLKQYDVAKILNITQSCYGKYERGDYSIPTQALIKLCLFYNVSADYILGLPDLPYPKR